MRVALAISSGLLALLVSTSSPPRPAFAQPNPDGIIQVDRSLEKRAYDESTEALLTYFWPLMYEIDRLPDPPSPADIKATPIRTLLLNYRLMMDFHAFVYEPGLLDAYRGALVKAYDAVGKYRDLLDIEEITGAPPDSRTLAVRLARMNFALAPLRFNAFREDTKEFAYSRASSGRAMREDEVPEIWAMSGVRPDSGLNDLGNAAMLAHGVLGRIQTDGILVSDVRDPEQEDYFRHVRRSLRDMLVLGDMYPSLSEQVASARAPLAAIVDAYGEVNARLDAWQAAAATGSPKLRERRDELDEAIKEARAVAEDAIRRGSIQTYRDRLSAAMAANRR